MAHQQPHNPAAGAGSGGFATTQWSTILAAGADSSPQAQGALERLCRAYRYPLYVHVRRLGWKPEDAEDMTQEFLARFIGRNYLQRADPERGRFRSFLLTSLKHFLADEWDKLQTQKRGGGRPPLSWDDLSPEERYRMEPAETLTPDLAYEKRWAGMLLERVLDQLRAEDESNGSLREFDLLKNHVWGDGKAGAYADLAAALNMEANALKVAVHRLRKRFREQLRQEVLSTLSSPDELDEEMRHLQLLLSS
ncbi:MAG: hypothetical protein QOF48_2158 [Verrucomicrobiota bacterium]|jgi:RNA polymerase sigma-70 factor (ECF subfamily)